MLRAGLARALLRRRGASPATGARDELAAALCGSHLADPSLPSPSSTQHLPSSGVALSGPGLSGSGLGSGDWWSSSGVPSATATLGVPGLGSGERSSERRRGWSSQAPDVRGESIYIHHTDVGSAVNSRGLTVGLMAAVQALSPGVGYFRPIDHTSHGGRRAELVREVFGIRTPLDDMMGVTQEQAVELVAAERLDDLLELILPAFERCKAQHDYLVVEGTVLRDGSNTAPLNGLLASTLGCPTLLVNDAYAAARNQEPASFEEVEWERDAAGSVVDHARVMRHSRVHVAGALFYHVPRVARGTQRLQGLLEAAGIPLVGAIPADKTLEALQLEDVRKVLDASQIYGQEDTEGGFMAVDINKMLVATLSLQDFLPYIPTSESPSQGALVVAHANRPDVLLGCINLHETGLPTQVAGVVLTGGTHPPIDIDTLIRSRPGGCTLPVLLSPMDTAETVIALANARGELHITSTRKIERAEVLFQQNVDMEVLNTALFKGGPMSMNPKMFQHNLFVKAMEAQQHIVLPEGEEPRTVQAAGELSRRSLCRLTLLGDPARIQTLAKQFRVDLGGVEIVDPSTSERLEEYAQFAYEKRKHKGLTLDAARDLMSGDVTFFGTAMVALGHADGMVSGAVHTTAATVRPALQLIKTAPETPLVSSVFFMCLPDKVLVYGDCAVNESPSPEDLATIAISSADTAAAFGIQPRVAMLSYATGDSNSGPLIQKVADATAIAKKRRPDLAIEGPLQYDAAVNPETARTKMKGKATEVAGKATVLIFPDLNTGNNTYKAVQQSTGAVAMGPVLQGLRKPVNDLSRGCTVKDIVTTVAITSLQAYAMKNAK